LRGSSLVAVEHVHIAGVHGAGAAQIRAALDDAATRMTTMDFHAGALRSAVGSYAIVGAVRVKTSFPHTVSIEVSERPPVAALVSAGQRTAVAADGTVLGPSLLSRALPTVSGSIEPVTGARVGEATTLAALAVLGAAPAPLARFVTRVYNDGPEGLTVAMRNGLLVYFGNDTRPHAKWLSLARVLTSPSSAGALYVDVRLPERPAAGFSAISGATSATVPSSGTPTSNAASSSSSVQSANADPTAAALAASLERAVGGSSTTTAATPESEASANEGESAAAGSTTSETGQSEASSEASTSTGG
jgi:cell division protein FtsQ